MDIQNFIVSLYDNLKACKYPVGNLIRNVTIEINEKTNTKYYKFNYEETYNKLKASKYGKFVKEEEFIYKDNYSNLKKIANLAKIN